MVLWYIVIGAFFALSVYSHIQTVDELKDQPDNVKMMVCVTIFLFWPAIILWGLSLMFFGENDE